VQDSQTDWDFSYFITDVAVTVGQLLRMKKTKIFIEQGKSFLVTILEFVVISRGTMNFFYTSYSGRTSVQNELGKL
jgi:hypothetical protein